MVPPGPVLCPVLEELFRMPPFLLLALSIGLLHVPDVCK